MKMVHPFTTIDARSNGCGGSVFTAAFTAAFAAVCMAVLTAVCTAALTAAFTAAFTAVITAAGVNAEASAAEREASPSPPVLDWAPDPPPAVFPLAVGAELEVVTEEDLQKEQEKATQPKQTIKGALQLLSKRYK